MTTDERYLSKYYDGTAISAQAQAEAEAEAEAEADFQAGLLLESQHARLAQAAVVMTGDLETVVEDEATQGANKQAVDAVPANDSETTVTNNGLLDGVGKRVAVVPARTRLEEVVDAMMRVPGQHSVYALGDIAAQTGPDGKLLPGLAQVARQQGLHLGAGLAALIVHGKELEPFQYRPRGDTAIIGRHAAVFEHKGLNVTGWAAWIAWAFIHIYLLIGFPHRLSVAIQWLWRYLTYDRTPDRC